MGVRIYNREFLPVTNDVSTDFLIGNVLSKIAFNFEVGVEFGKTFTESDNVRYDKELKALTTDKGTWAELGIKQGDTITGILYSDSSSSSAGNVVITPNVVDYIDEGVLYLTNNLGSASGDFSSFRCGTANVKDLKVVVEAQPDSTEFRFNLLSNLDIDSGSMDSFLTGTSCWFEGDGINTATPKLLNIQGSMTGMYFEDVYILETETPTGGTGSYETKYQIIGKFYVWGLVDGNTDFDTLEAPEWFLDGETLNDIIKADFYRTYRDPNYFVSSGAQKGDKLGNVGWLEEAFNGYPNNDLVAGAEVLLLPTNDLHYNTDQRIRVTLNQQINANTRVQCWIACIPRDLSELQDSTNNLLQNLIFTRTTENGWSESMGEGTGLPYTNEVFYKTLADGTQVGNDFQMTDFRNSSKYIDFWWYTNGDMMDYMANRPSDDRYYVVVVDIADNDTTTGINTGNRTNHLVLWGNMVELVEPREYLDETKVYKHTREPDTAEDCYDTSTSGDIPDSVKLYKEDEFVVETEFELGTDDDLQNAWYALGIYNRFDDNYDVNFFRKKFDLTGLRQDVFTGEWVLDDNQMLDFQPLEDNPKYNARIWAKSFDAGTGVTTIGMRMTYRCHFNETETEATPVQFFNPTLPLNGESADWSKYYSSGFYPAPYFDTDVKRDGDVIVTKGRYPAYLDVVDYDTGTPTLDSFQVTSPTEGLIANIDSQTLMLLEEDLEFVAYISDTNFDFTAPYPKDITDKYFAEINVYDEDTKTIYNTVQSSTFYPDDNNSLMTDIELEAVSQTQVRITGTIKGQNIINQGITNASLTIRINCRC